MGPTRTKALSWNELRYGSAAGERRAESHRDDSRLLKETAHETLEPWIDWLALKGQDAEDTFVDPPQRLAADESVQGLDAEREFAGGEGALG